jgi:hypothetical protein
MNAELRIALSTILMMVGASPLAEAISTSFTENGDWGDLTENAQILSGVGGTDITRITGSLRSPNDFVDMFKFNLDPRSFFAGTSGSNFDTQLFLFNRFGHGVCSTDDTKRKEFTSTLTASGCGIPLNEAGTYFLAISPYDLDPKSSDGLIFLDTPFDPNGVLGTLIPTGPGRAKSVSEWENLGGGFQQGSYEISLDGAFLITRSGGGDGGGGGEEGQGADSGSGGGSGFPEDDITLCEIRGGTTEFCKCLESNPTSFCERKIPEPSTLLLLAVGLSASAFPMPKNGGKRPKKGIRLL